MKLKLPLKLPRLTKTRLLKFIVILFVLPALILTLYEAGRIYTGLTSENQTLRGELETIKTQVGELESRDEFKINEEQKLELEKIKSTYSQAVTVYEKLLDYKSKSKDTSEFDELFASALSKLSEPNYDEAEKNLTEITAQIEEEEQKIAESFTIPESVPVSSTPPSQGYSRQNVEVSGLGNYLVSIVAADISSTRIIVDTASSGDCGNDCPVLSLAEYVSRNGAYAGINGTYFCPAIYPSCAGKTNTFDLLLMNKDKTYFNSDNNVYSSNPGVIFGSGYIRFVSAVSQWGRDTSIDSMISNFPLLVFNKNVVFGGDDDPKKGSKGGRSFVANQGNKIFIGVVHNATVAESARVLHALGVDNAMNLDDGGSTALWSGGYKVGPGRNLPNVILFVNK